MDKSIFLKQLIKRTSIKNINTIKIYSLSLINNNNPNYKYYYSTSNYIKTTSIMTDYKGSTLELECINTIRAVSADMVQSANSGHPGAPMGCAPIAYLLWNEIMNYSPTSPKWINRDRFVLSNGHACALQYVMLHLTGYADSKISDLKQFRQLGSTTPGHPESFVTAGTFTTKLQYLTVVFLLLNAFTFTCDTMYDGEEQTTTTIDSSSANV
jgi:hypothetical protein